MNLQNHTILVHKCVDKDIEISTFDQILFSEYQALPKKVWMHKMNKNKLINLTGGAVIMS